MYTHARTRTYGSITQQGQPAVLSSATNQRKSPLDPPLTHSLTPQFVCRLSIYVSIYKASSRAAFSQTTDCVSVCLACVCPLEAHTPLPACACLTVAFSCSCWRSTGPLSPAPPALTAPASPPRQPSSRPDEQSAPSARNRAAVERMWCLWSRRGRHK